MLSRLITRTKSSQFIQFRSLHNNLYSKSPISKEHHYLLTPHCLEFLTSLNNDFNEEHTSLLEDRKLRLENNDYDFRLDTKHIRDDHIWKATKLPVALQCRHVELTGPGNIASMLINGLNSGADGYMIDKEDSATPIWKNTLDSCNNVYQALRGRLTAEKRNDKGELIKMYQVTAKKIPTIFVRSRGLHMFENNIVDNNENPIPAMLFDLGLHMFHNGLYLQRANQGPFVYIPKIESYEEALFLDKVFTKMESDLNIQYGSTKATLLIETFPAIFQTEEIIHALRNHIAGLNCGRWDYICSVIKSNNDLRDMCMSDRSSQIMSRPYLESYVRQIVKTCHNRGISAMGGMSAFVPSKDPKENTRINDLIEKDKIVEIERGCDGGWVAHPDLVKPIKEVFLNHLGRNNQIDSTKSLDYNVTKNDLMNLTSGKYSPLDDINEEFTKQNLINNINVSMQYISAWLSGNGCVALNGLMEDLATVEISVHQTRQWLEHNVKYDSSCSENLGHNTLTNSVLRDLIRNELNNLQKENQIPYAEDKLELAADIFYRYVTSPEYQFLPQIASEYLNTINGFEGIQYTPNELYRLSGSRQYLTGVDLTKERGDFLTNYMFNSDKKHPYYKFLGTMSGIAAVNVIAGSNGTAGPYVGGWQINANNMNLGDTLPDILHVTPKEPSDYAHQFNNHIKRADMIQHLELLNDPSYSKYTNYHDIAMLADMEQGWNTTEKIRMGVKLAIEQGVNVMHIEDQGDKKRCGHLGDKELNGIEEYCMIMRAANLAAQEMLGPDQAKKQWVRFVARTDAYSAKRIINYTHIHDETHEEYKFIDWKRGPSNDGKYLFLKQGINPETNNIWGLDLAIQRCARVVDEGLASHVWMETPDADLRIAKIFLNGVNDILAKKGKKAYGLYNHSQSFDWLRKFIKDAHSFANSLCFNTVEYDLKSTNSLQKFISTSKSADKFVGDHMMTVEGLEKLCVEIKADNVENVKAIIADERLKNFEPILATFGYNLHLSTLPDYHLTALSNFNLAKGFEKHGIFAYIDQVQKEEINKHNNDPNYTFFTHQTSNGTGLAAEFNNIVGSSDTNVLADSTESDDLEKFE